MMKITHICILTICFCLPARGQITNPSIIRLIDKVRSDNMLGHSTAKDTDLEGSFYLNDQFQTGTIYTLGDIFYDSIPLRYNIYLDAMEITYENEILQIFPNSGFPKIKISGRIFESLTEIRKNKSDKGYYELLVSGNFKLYEKHHVKIIKGEKGTGYSPPTPDRIIKGNSLFFMTHGDNNLVSIRNKDDITGLTGIKKSKVFDFIAKEKISFSRKEDLLQLFQLINSISD